jgi:hypothetical protein
MENQTLGEFVQGIVGGELVQNYRNHFELRDVNKIDFEGLVDQTIRHYEEKGNRVVCRTPQLGFTFEDREGDGVSVVFSYFDSGRSLMGSERLTHHCRDLVRA